MLHQSGLLIYKMRCTCGAASLLLASNKEQPLSQAGAILSCCKPLVTGKNSQISLLKRIVRFQTVAFNCCCMQPRSPGMLSSWTRQALHRTKHQCPRHRLAMSACLKWLQELPAGGPQLSLGQQVHVGSLLAKWEYGSAWTLWGPTSAGGATSWCLWARLPFWTDHAIEHHRSSAKDAEMYDRRHARWSCTAAGAFVGDGYMHLKRVRWHYMTVVYRSSGCSAGVLALASCSSHIDFKLFEQVCLTAVGRARRTATVLGVHGQPADHPYPAACPELRYLKFITHLLDW